METTPGISSIDEVSESLPFQEPSPVKAVSSAREGSSERSAKKGNDSVPVVSDDFAEEIAEKMNTVATVFNTSLAFSVDKPTGRTVIKVKDKRTDQIIRQIPPEETLRLISKMRDVMGLIFDIEI